MNFWMLSITPENYDITRARGFTLQGFTRKSRRKVQRMEPGDRLLFYVTGVRRFPATATVVGTFFEDHTRIWTSHRQEEDFPYRVRIRPAVVLPLEQGLDAMEIAPRLDYVRRWPPERWPLALIGELHILSRRDFEFIEGEMRKVARALRPRAG